MTDQIVDVAAFLEERKEEILVAARASVGRAHLAHYEADGPDASHERLRTLLDLVIASCRNHDVVQATTYAEALAAERHGSGYSLSEVQIVINVLEEAIWRSITIDLPAEAQGYALGLVSTALGTVKDTLARGYIAQISSHPMKSLHIDSLFLGTEGAHPHQT